MFTIKRTFGDHSVLSLDTTKHKFAEFFKNLYKTEELNKLHLKSTEFSGENLSDIETSLHKTFYTEIKSNDTFKRLYCTLIKDIYTELFPEEKYIIYQSFPSVRFQFINNVAVPPHYDSDSLGCHPIGEKNFLLPITEMVGTKRLFIESSPGKADYKGIDLDYGELFYFNGNKCTHFNEKNVEDTIRISLDFRVILLKDYLNYINSGSITTTNPRDPEKKRIPTKMIIGGYYQLAEKDQTIDQMMNWHFQKEMLLQSRPNFDEKEAVACYNYMKDGVNFITEFKQTEELEKMICTFTGAKHTIMTTSGNMALVLALMGYEFPSGSEIIVPNYTMIASINSIKMAGYKPVIIDVDKDTLTISKSIIETAITPATRAVMHVSLNNRHSNMNEIVELCKQKGIELIEDAAQSLGCFIDGKHFGTFGSIGCFSLSTPKIISTGQGGFCVTNSDELARKMRMIKNFGRVSGGIDIFEIFGINMKFTDIQAVIGIEQMKKLPDRITRMRQIYDKYYDCLKDNSSIRMIEPTFNGWIPWFVDIFINKRDDLMNFLKIHNIQTRSTYPEINKTPMYNDDKEFAISKYVSDNGLFLPSHTVLTDTEIEHICKLINIFF
jgi:perosamine synthetase